MARLRAATLLPSRRIVSGRADEDDAVLGAGIDEFRAFGQEAVARMDRVRARFSLAMRIISSMDR
jgi:hypothetical protein